MFYLVGLFDLWSGVYTLGFSAAAAYIIAATMKDAYMPWVAFVVLMGHMSVSHLYRQAANKPSAVDITGTLSKNHKPALYTYCRYKALRWSS
jgi:lysophospholipid acyltransferase